MPFIKSLENEMDAAARRPGQDHQRQVTGHVGIIEANVYQRTVDYPEEFSNGYHVMLDSERLPALSKANPWGIERNPGASSERNSPVGLKICTLELSTSAT